MADVRVLVVDDEPSIVRMVKRVLTARGIGQVDGAGAAAETMLRALLAGADDYLLKRCCAIGPDVEEMLARRRSPPAASKVVRRAEEKLGVGNRFQLVRLLTVLSGFGVRARAAAEGTGT